MADVTGIVGLTSLHVNPDLWAGIAASAAIVAVVAAAWLWARRAGARSAALDWYALLGTVVVTGMMFSSSEWYEHYAAFAGPFVVLLIALSVARFAAVRKRRPGRAARAGRRGWAAAAATVLVLAIAAMAAADGYSATRLQRAINVAAGTGLIPAGACVLTDTASATIVLNRFTALSPGCPELVDAVGTLIATTYGQDFDGSLAVRLADTRAWQSAFSHAQYVWLIGNSGYTGARIFWTPALHAYFIGHFSLIGFASSFRGKGDVPRGGLYRRAPATARNSAA
jgi:hypothetical protein